jgi:replication-associated recombination protein RarA
MALVLANAAAQAANSLAGRGPDSLAEAIHRDAAKSNSTVAAIDSAMKDVESGRTLPVPEHLRYQLCRHDAQPWRGLQIRSRFSGTFVAQTTWALRHLLQPSDQGVERKSRRLEKWKELARRGVKRRLIRIKPD